MMEQKKKSKSYKVNKALNYFCLYYTIILRVMSKLRSQVQNEEVFCMFDFLRKSRVIKFLCSACLMCSLGSFACVYSTEPDPDSSDETSYADSSTDPVEIGSAEISTIPIEIGYARLFALLGISKGSVGLKNARLDLKGKLLSGLLALRKNDDTWKNLENTSESSKIRLYLTDENNNQVAATTDIDLSNKSYNLSQSQFYSKNVTSGFEDANGTEPNFEPEFRKDYKVFCRITDEGKDTIIAMPE